MSKFSFDIAIVLFCEISYNFMRMEYISEIEEISSVEILLFVLNGSFDLIFLITWAMYLRFWMICLENILRRLSEKDYNNVRDLMSQIQDIESFSVAMNLSFLFFFSAAQAGAILGAYAMIANKTHYIGYILFSISLFPCIFIQIGRLESIYNSINLITRNLRHDAVESGSIKEMMQYQNAALQLERLVPFTAYGFFSLERSTLTAMAATTLTYLIILIQMV